MEAEERETIGFTTYQRFFKFRSIGTIKIKTTNCVIGINHAARNKDFHGQAGEPRWYAHLRARPRAR